MFPVGLSADGDGAAFDEVAVGVAELEALATERCDGPSAVVDAPVVEAAKQDKIVEIGWAVGVVDDVVRVKVPLGVAAWDGTAAVAESEHASLIPVGEPDLGAEFEGDPSLMPQDLQGAVLGETVHEAGADVGAGFEAADAVGADDPRDEGVDVDQNVDTEVLAAFSTELGACGGVECEVGESSEDVTDSGTPVRGVAVRGVVIDAGAGSGSAGSVGVGLGVGSTGGGGRGGVRLVEECAGLR